MPSRKSYNRFFIILQEDQKGYGADANKTPSGYAKLEMRNDRAKTSFYVQDIKKQNGPYYMVLIAQGNNGSRELINLGQINIDEGGKADISNEHDANNIASSNISMERIQGAGICKINGTKVNPVMVGFICGEELKNWATYPVAKGVKASAPTARPSEGSSEGEVKKVVKTEVKKEVKETEERKAEVVEKKQEKKEELDTTIKQTQDFDEYEEQIERLKEYRKKHSSKKCDEEQEEYEEHHEHHHKDEEPVGPMGEFFKDVVKGLEKLGHKNSVKNCIWYKASVESLDDMYCVEDYNKYSVIFYPMICYYPYIAKNKSFRIGYKCDDEGNLKYIIYAIAGTKALIDQPYEGKTGFVTFMSDAEDSEKGHWLMYYDVKNNTVVVPVKTAK